MARIVYDRKRTLIGLLVIVLGVLGGLLTLEARAAPPQQGTPTSTPLAPVTYGYTHVRADGNRYATGRGRLPETVPVDVPLSGRPLWVVGAADGAGSIWVVALESGEVQAFRVQAGGVVSPVSVVPSFLPPGMPPVLRVVAGVPSLVNVPADASPLTAPAVLPGERVAYLTEDGAVGVLDGAGTQLARLDLHALPDARLLVDEAGTLTLLCAPSEDYTHGVLGDALEALDICQVETAGGLYSVGGMVVAAQPGEVIEGIAPLWVDLNGDGQRELLATLSDARLGARITLLAGDGSPLAYGPAIGQGYRWRHQVAVAPFGPDGALELADVLTPHIGGVVEFYRVEEDRLVVVAEVPGYTSHVIHTRNLDMAAAGDFDGDGQVELLLPQQDRTALGGIRRTEDGAEVAWAVPLDGVLVTNLAAVTLSGDRLAAGVGLEDGVLRLWLPE